MVSLLRPILVLVLCGYCHASHAMLPARQLCIIKEDWILFLESTYVSSSCAHQWIVHCCCLAVEEEVGKKVSSHWSKLCDQKGGRYGG
jgi:hypothetical protein